MFVFALAEVGYIFFWTISQKPYELYSVLNMDRCKHFNFVYHVFNIGDGKLSRFLTDCVTDCDDPEPPDNSSKTVGGSSSKDAHRVIAHDESSTDEFNFNNHYQGLHDDNCSSNRDDSFSKSSKFTYSSKEQRKTSNKERKH